MHPRNSARSAGDFLSLFPAEKTQIDAEGILEMHPRNSARSAGEKSESPIELI